CSSDLIPYMRVSEISKAEKMGKDTVFLLDTVGQLMGFYSCASIVFVGGSLVKKGGHNILEPVFLGKPVFFGPHMFNFRDITSLFLSNGAAVQVNDREQCKQILRRWLLDYREAEALGEKGRSLIERNRGATVRNLEYIAEIIKSGQYREHSS
ncbi:MAG: 3-deoxy-D-manno-octulosonic acid transferase, partial [Candidatus Omnitrophica bacterium]|nr:3-deoxy-D-manno-octulosonic acid transferase [Candidatus Omnitrophota bacterium]